MMQVIKNFFLAFLEETLQLTLRGPFIIVALSPLIASSGAWQYFASSWAAFDVQRAAHWTQATTRIPTVAVIAIDDAGYQGFFEAKSPIDRGRVEALLRTVAEHSKNAKRIAIDLDLSPVPGQAEGQAVLDRLFLENPKLWVLPAVDSGSEADIASQRQWRLSLCSQGVSLGRPFVPNAFGYPKLTHQFKDGLADMSLQPPGVCADPSKPFEEKPMVLSPTVLANPVMVPFSGDLAALGQMLDYIDAEWLFVGGAWGPTDIYGTPFGDRYGVVIHLAALAGALSNEREASYLVSLVASFLFLSLCTVILKYMNTWLDRFFRPQSPRMVGHQFYLERLQPVQFVLTVFALLYLSAEILSMLRAQTGYWIPSSIVGTTALGSLLLTWNWGQNKVPDHHNFKHLWKVMIVDPITLEIQSVKSAYSVIRHGSSRSTWGVGLGTLEIGRGRAATEGFLALLSLMMQTVVPLGSIVYAVADAIFSQPQGN